MKSRTNRPKLVSLPTAPVSSVVRLRHMPTPAHLRTEFSPEDADIRTLVRNVLHGREVILEARGYVQLLGVRGQLDLDLANELLGILNRQLEGE